MKKGLISYSIMAAFVFITSCSVLNNSSRINRMTMKDNLIFKTGLWVENIDSNIVLIVKYKNGKKEGKAKKYYTNGDYERLFYQNNKINGLLLRYTKGDKLVLKQEYSNDSLLSEWIYTNNKAVLVKWGTPRW